MKAALHLYFGRIEVKGMEHIDNGKPSLILANHTASFMDAVITACFIKRRIHFFARGDVFKHKWADKLLRSLGLLPVYRLIDGREMLQLNDSSNEEALKILAAGGAVLIFAEGSSHTAKVMKPLKKGPFRLAVTAAATLPEAPLLVPLGINYVAPASPFGDAFLRAAAPLRTADFPPTRDTNAAKAATDMMRATASALSPLVWHVGDHARQHLADALLAFLKNARPDYSFEDTQRLLGRLNGNPDPQDPGLPADLAGLRWKAKPGQADWGVYSQRLRPAQWIGIILGGPLALVGYLGHFLPLRFSKYLADSQVKDADFWAPVFLCCAVVSVILWNIMWLATGIAAGIGIHALIGLALLAGCGIFYLKWYRPMWLAARPGPESRPESPFTHKIQSSMRHFIDMALSGSRRDN